MRALTTTVRGCSCAIQAVVEETYRTNYGYTDHTLSTQLDETTADPQDRIRFLPSDTAYVRMSYEILNGEQVRSGDARMLLQLRAYPVDYTSASYKKMALHPDMRHAELVE